MNDLTAFLAWFEGFAENIDDAPNERQWARIKERVQGLPGAAKVPPVAAPVPAPPPPPPPKPTTAKEWLKAYEVALTDMGVDHGSAKDYAGDIAETFSMDDDPRAVAKSNMGSILSS